MSAPKWAVGMQKIGPGMYVDATGALHVRAEEICEALDYEPTEANLRTAELGAIDALKQANPDVKISEVGNPDPR